MKKLFCITSHCNTDERIEKLREIITTIKRRGYDVLLISHIPLDSSIVGDVNHYIFNDRNEILYFPERYIKYWKTTRFENKYITLSCCSPDYTWSYCNQVKTIGNYCNNLDYHNYVFVNYDVLLSDSLLDYVRETDGNFFNRHFLVDANGTSIQSISLLLFQLNKEDLIKFSNSLSKEQYVDHENKIPVPLRNAEHYFEYLLEYSGIDYQLLKTKIQTLFSANHTQFNENLNFNNENEYFKLFSDNKHTVIYDLINPIKFRINNIDILLESNTVLADYIECLGYYDYNNKLVNLTNLFNFSYKEFNPKVEINE